MKRSIRDYHNFIEIGRPKQKVKGLKKFGGPKQKVKPGRAKWKMKLKLSHKWFTWGKPSQSTFQYGNSIDFLVCVFCFFRTSTFTFTFTSTSTSTPTPTFTFTFTFIFTFTSTFTPTFTFTLTSTFTFTFIDLLLLRTTIVKVDNRYGNECEGPRHVGSRFSGESTHQNQIANFYLVLVRNGWSWLLSLVSKHFHRFHLFQLYHGFPLFHLIRLF